MSIFFVKEVGGDLSGKFDRSRSGGKAFIYAQDGEETHRPVLSVSLESHSEHPNPLDPFKVAKNLADAMNGVEPQHAMDVQFFDPAWVRKKDSLEIVLLNRFRGRESHTAVVNLIPDLPDTLRDEVAEKITRDSAVSKYMKTFVPPPYVPTATPNPALVS